MRECLLSCVEQALYDKSVEKRLNTLGDELRSMGGLVGLRVALLEKAAAKQLTSLAKLKLKVKGLFNRGLTDRGCCC